MEKDNIGHGTNNTPDFKSEKGFEFQGVPVTHSGTLQLIGGPHNLTGTATKVLGVDEEGNVICDTTIKEYIEFVKSMKIYPEKHAIIYPALGISGEAGEVAEKVKKWLRGDKELNKEEVVKELGDIMWYITSLADDLGYSLQDVVDLNVLKLKDRTKRGVKKGDGDNR